jgi:protein-tyrosine phosphatase
MIDLHCHVLPGLDDGPGDLPAALTMARRAVALGTSTMVATPHIDHHWGVSPGAVKTRAALLAEALAAEGVELEIRTGGEIALSRLADLSASELDEVRLGNGPYLLLECPMSQAEGDFDVLMLRIRERGESIVLAHPERAPLFQREPERLVRCVEAGLLCSISAGALRGEFGGHVRGFTIELLRAGLVHDIASDSHDHLRRPPGLAGVLELAEFEIPGIGRQASWLTTLAPAAILEGAPLPPRPGVLGPAS